MSVFLLVQAGTYIRNGPRLALIDLRRVGGGLGKRDPRSYMHVSRGAIGEVTDITDIQTEKSSFQGKKMMTASITTSQIRLSNRSKKEIKQFSFDVASRHTSPDNSRQTVWKKLKGNVTNRIVRGGMGM